MHPHSIYSAATEWTETTGYSCRSLLWSLKSVKISGWERQQTQPTARLEVSLQSSHSHSIKSSKKMKTTHSFIAVHIAYPTIDTPISLDHWLSLAASLVSRALQLSITTAYRDTGSAYWPLYWPACLSRGQRYPRAVKRSRVCINLHGIWWQG